MKMRNKYNRRSNSKCGGEGRRPALRDNAKLNVALINFIAATLSRNKGRRYQLKSS